MEGGLIEMYRRAEEATPEASVTGWRERTGRYELDRADVGRAGMTSAFRRRARRGVCGFTRPGQA